MRTNERLQSWIFRWPVWACGFGGLFLFQFLGNPNRGYIDTGSLFVWWGRQWLDPASELQHAWVLLALSLWIFWDNLKRHSTAETPPTAFSAWKLCAFFGAALLLHTLGFLMQQARVSLLALLLFVWAWTALAGGRRWARASVMPLFLLLGAMPLGFFDAAGFWLRLWVVEASQAAAQACGVAVERSGTQLFSSQGAYHYDVAAACSGVRSLQALLSLALVAGYLAFRPWFARLLVVGLVFPLVYAGNLVRILSILFSSERWGEEVGTRAHTVSGPIVFFAILGFVLLAIALLRRRNPSWVRAQAAPEAEASLSELGLELATPKSWDRAGMWSLGLLAFAACGAFWLSSVRAEAAVGIRLAADGVNPVALPQTIGRSWFGRAEAITPVERDILPPDTGFSRKIYHSMDGASHGVLCSVVLSGKDRSSIHRPELCLVGQGWTVESSAERQLATGERSERLSVTVLKVTRTVPGRNVTVPAYVVYWFIGADRQVAGNARRMWADAASRLRGHPQRWAYVLLQTYGLDGEDAALARIQEVARGVVPVLRPPSQRE